MKDPLGTMASLILANAICVDFVWPTTKGWSVAMATEPNKQDGNDVTIIGRTGSGRRIAYATQCKKHILELMEVARAECPRCKGDVCSLD